jgi:hypothetical protein
MDRMNYPRQAHNHAERHLAWSDEIDACSQTAGGRHTWSARPPQPTINMSRFYKNQNSINFHNGPVVVNDDDAINDPR